MGILQTTKNSLKFVEKIRNFGICHLLAPFQWDYLGNLVTARDGGNQSTYYHKFSAQSIWRVKNASKLDEK
jgi:hypothetical protein